MQKSSFLVLALAAAGFVLLNFNTLAQAQIVYEGFDYTADAEFNNTPLNGGVGWDNAWVSTGPGADFHTVGSGLALGTLKQISGSAVRAGRFGTSAIDRSITAASMTALTADNSTVWFSVLMSPLGNPQGSGTAGPGYELNMFGTIVIGDTALGQQTSGVNPAANTGSAVGVGFSGRNGSTTVDNITYAGMTIQGVTYNAGTLTQNINNRILVGGTTSLIVGKIDWAANGSDDTVSLYNVFDPTAALPAAFSTMTVDLNQSTFNVVSISGGQTHMFDEIRFGTSQADVLPLGSSTVLLGDVDMDGTVNFLDISPFIAVLSSAGFQAEADCDQSGEVDFLDISPFIAILSGGPVGIVASDRFADLEEHILGTDTMTVAELQSWSTTFQSEANNLENNLPDFVAAVEVVELYEDVIGPLFTPAGHQSFASSWGGDNNVGRGLARTMLGVYQAIFDGIDPQLVAQQPAIVDGIMFRSTEYFPGSVPNPADPTAIYQVQIDAALDAEFGSPGGYNTNAARRMTGAYLAPGSIAEVIVPNELVNAGYEVRVGGHSWDLSNKNTANRLYRVSNTFAITGNVVEVANPMGGNIYIEVPVGADAGIVNVQFRNTIRAPFFSSRSFDQTSQTQWQNVERHHPGAFTDIESEHSMWTVPSKWVTNLGYNALMQIIEAHDANMQVASEYVGKNTDRHKAILYMIVDTQIRANAFSIGYPQSNYGSFAQNSIRAPLTLDNAFNKVLWHEHGHAEYMTMFSGEPESWNHMLAVAIGMENYGLTAQDAFAESLAYGSTNHDTSDALNSWVVMDEFLNGQNMAYQQGSYRPRGHADYVEYVEMFGLEAIQKFNRQINIEMDGLDWNAWPHGRTNHNYNNRILRLSREAGVNVAPLFHLWGHSPSNASALATSMATEGLGASVQIYDRMIDARDSVPLNQSQWNAVDSVMKDFLNEARGPWAALKANYDVARGQAAVDRIQVLIDLYFPTGRP